MLYLQAEYAAARISRAYGRTVIFREHSKRESYQAVALSADEKLDPKLGSIVAVYSDGAAA